MNYVVTPAARRDILVQYRFYGEERGVPRIAERFLDAVQDTIDKICQTPGIGTPKDFNLTTLSGVRSSLIKGFSQIRVYYTVQNETLRVIRVLHGKRDIHPSLEEDGDDN